MTSRLKDTILYSVFALTEYPYGVTAEHASLLTKLVYLYRYDKSIEYSIILESVEDMICRKRGPLIRLRRRKQDYIVAPSCKYDFESFKEARFAKRAAHYITWGAKRSEVLAKLFGFDELPPDSTRGSLVFLDWYSDIYVKKYPDDGIYFVYQTLKTFRTFRRKVRFIDKYVPRYRKPPPKKKVVKYVRPLVNLLPRHLWK